MRTRDLPHCDSYADALALQKQATRPGRLCNNTRVVRRIGGVSVILYSTTILMFSPVHIRLDSGGSRAVTTKSRMNALLPENTRVFQRDYGWTVHRIVGGIHVIVPFVDGMTIPYSGTLTPAPGAPRGLSGNRRVVST